MRKFLKITLWSLGFLTVAMMLVLAFNFFSYKQKGSDLFKSYSSCENGGYKRYFYGYTDGSSTYYDRYGSQIGSCDSWIAGPTCAPAEEAAGQCTPIEGLSIGFIIFLFLNFIQSLL